jgi:hypothetical protein
MTDCSSEPSSRTSDDVSKDIAAFEDTVVHPPFDDDNLIKAKIIRQQFTTSSDQCGNDINDRAKTIRAGIKKTCRGNALSLVMRGLVSPFLPGSIYLTDSDEEEEDYVDALHTYVDCLGKKWIGNEDVKYGLVSTVHT